jgi:hypothetical protein
MKRKTGRRLRQLLRNVRKWGIQQHAVKVVYEVLFLFLDKNCQCVCVCASCVCGDVCVACVCVRVCLSVSLSPSLSL